MITVLGDRVLVALPPKVHESDETTGYTYQAGPTTPSGLIVAKPADVYNVDLATRGLVLQVGEKHAQVDVDEVRDVVTATIADRFNPAHHHPADEVGHAILEALDALEPAPFSVAVGDCVLFPATAGDQIEVDGVPYVILHESDLLAIVDPHPPEAA